MQGTTGAADKARAVEEDAGAVNDPSIGTGLVAEDAPGLRRRRVLEDLWVDGVGQCRHHHRFLDPVQLGTERATSTPQLGGPLGLDAMTTAAPDARPVGLEEAPVDPPHRVAGVDLDR